MSLRDIRFSGLPPCGTALEHREIIDLVGLLLDNVPAGVRPTGSDVVILEALGGGRSGAYVFKVTLSAGFGPGCGTAPMVVKIVPLVEGRCEKANYDRFVRALLPADCRPDLLGFVEAHGRAALCYSFVGDGERPATLTDRLAAGDMAAAGPVLSTLFEALRKSWYGPRRIEAASDLAGYYLDRYFGNAAAATRAEGVLFGWASRYHDARHRGDGYSIGETAFPSVCATLFACAEARGYRGCVVHGDLNTDNVIIDRDRGFAGLVDFRRTGRGHIYQDFVSLEASVRINYPSNASSSEILDVERSVAGAAPCGSGNGYATAIGDIREAARDCFRIDADPFAYHFAVAAVGLRLTRATDLSHAACARISASTLWAVKTLAEISSGVNRSGSSKQDRF